MPSDMMPRIAPGLSVLDLARIAVTVDQARASQRQHDLLAGGDVGSAGDDRQRVLAGLDIGQNQPVGVRDGVQPYST